MGYPDTPIAGRVTGMGWGIFQKDGSTAQQLLPKISASYQWVRWPERVPVRIELDEVPEGWSYLLETGTADVYRATQTPFGPGIAVHSENDQGILRKAVDLPLEDDTRLCWRWRLDEFPSELAENRVTTHDYLSIAVEFDNGRDLTWFWSRRLPVGTHFGCPVKSWNYREIHYCVRSGEAQRGAWQREERAIAADCAEALGEVPGRLVAVWLIVVSSFQHGVARGEFADICVETASDRHRVL